MIVQVLPGYPLHVRIPMESAIQRRCGTLVLRCMYGNPFLTYLLISHLGRQRFARSVCLVTCRGIGKGQGVKDPHRSVVIRLSWKLKKLKCKKEE